MEETAKFKIGDRVKVVKILTETGYRDEYIGKEFTIESINPNGSNLGPHYGVKEHCIFIFDEDEL